MKIQTYHITKIIILISLFCATLFSEDEDFQKYAMFSTSAERPIPSDPNIHQATTSIKKARSNCINWKYTF